MRIVALDDYNGAFRRSRAAEDLRQAGHEVHSEEVALRGEDLIRVLRGAEAVLLTQQRTPFPVDAVRASTGLRWLLNTGRSTGHIDMEACRAQGVEVVLAGGGNAAPAAELTWALILASARGLEGNCRACREGRWQASTGTGLWGKTLGIYGLGAIGNAVAKVGAALGMRVLCYGREASKQAAAVAGYEVAGSREQLFSEADVLSVHLKPTPETLGCISSRDLALMKPTALFVNTARAALVEPGALVAALRAGRPGRAALDVFEEEPLPQGAALAALPNALLSPHLGYATLENLEGYYGALVSEFLRRAAGGSRL